MLQREADTAFLVAEVNQSGVQEALMRMLPMTVVLAVAVLVGCGPEQDDALTRTADQDAVAAPADNGATSSVDGTQNVKALVQTPGECLVDCSYGRCEVVGTPEACKDACRICGL